MSIDQDARFETLAIHAGQEPEPVTGAVMTPVYMTSTYAQTSPAKPVGDYEYSRSGNPTRTALEANLAALEQGARGLAFASGLAACNALLDRLEPGDHVVAGNDLYGGTWRLFSRVFERYGIQFSFVDTTDLQQVEAALEAEQPASQPEQLVRQARLLSAQTLSSARVLVPASPGVKRLQAIVYTQLQRAMLGQVSSDAALAEAERQWNAYAAGRWP